MSDIIHLLPDSIANQIAAGEVVQRPASAVKELLENSIDAGSHSIQLIVKEAGKTLIQVIDDGKGMSETDARMCFERHATSKIRKADDLFAIKTMGFRGEAMASIAAIAQVEMRTRRAEDELGTMVRIEASELKLQEPVACPAGTSISIKNLFYNVPARRNFLKSNAVEFRHILDEFIRVALANPSVAFSLYQNDLEVYNLHPGRLSQRIVAIFGNSYKEQLAACKEDTDLIKLSGYIGKPEFARKTRGEQFFFVNNRYIKHPYLHHAVMSAYENLLQDDSFPFYVLFIEIDPRHIDINVHPTKTEIKFDDDKTAYAIIQAAVKKALGAYNIAPSLDFDQNVNFELMIGQPSNPFAEADKHVTKPLDKPFDKPYDEINKGYTNLSPREKSNMKNWEVLYGSSANNANFRMPSKEELSATNNNQEITFESALNRRSVDPFRHEDSKFDSKTTFQIHNSYIVTQVKSGMMIVDQQAAHERILYERYMAYLQRKSGASQQLLFPQMVELSPADFTLIQELDEELKALGFIIEPMGKTTLIINGIPADIPAGNERTVLEGMLEQYKFQQSTLKLSGSESLARALARRSAMKRGTALSLQEMNALIDQLFACAMPGYAPDGNLTISLFDMDKLAGFFKKS
jgi:DNA mismatch repair protein MutL